MKKRRGFRATLLTRLLSPGALIHPADKLAVFLQSQTLPS
jgi:hypothetical protein